MRFVFIFMLSCLAAFCWCAFAAVTFAQQAGFSEDGHISNAQSRMEQVRQRTRSAAEKPAAPEGLIAERFAAQIGDVSAIAMDGSGALYSADEARGRIFRLVDRNRDGIIDSSRVIVSALDRPSGIAVIGAQLYIADAKALWVTTLDGGGARMLASFANAPAIPSPRPLAARRDGKALLLGLTDVGGQSGQVLSIDAQTGTAALLSRGDAPVTALAVSGVNAIWIGGGGKLIAVQSPVYVREDGYTLSSKAVITGILLPGQAETLPPEMMPWQHDILAAQGGRNHPQNSPLKSHNIIAIPTQLGIPAEGAKVWVDGFAASNMRSAWGQPGAMLMDQRGLFIADRWSGSLWLIKQAHLARVSVEKPVDPGTIMPVPETAGQADIAPKGSGISAGSTISQGSKLQVGSTIIANAEKAAAEKAAAEKKADAKKLGDEVDKKNPEQIRPDP